MRILEMEMMEECNTAVGLTSEVTANSVSLFCVPLRARLGTRGRRRYGALTDVCRLAAAAAAAAAAGACWASGVAAGNESPSGRAVAAATSTVAALPASL